MSSFTALMALSASKTQEQNNLVERVKEERRKKELLQQKQRAEQEAKEREMEKKLRIKRFEEEKREEERRKRREEAEKAREAAIQRKKDEQRDILLYGAKKAASSRASTSSSLAGSNGPKERRKGPDGNDDDSPSGLVLTREELRERRQQAEMKRLYSSTRRSATAHSYSKAGRRLPGGAVDITTTSASPDSLSGKSVKDRIASMPNTLTKLNTVKRDTRTIDEIRTDLQKKKEGKVLDGDEAKSFDDWFSTKKKEPIKKPHTSSSIGSGANTPTSSAPPPSNPSPSVKKLAAPPSSTARIPKISTAKSSMPKPYSQPSLKPTNGSQIGSFDKYHSSKGTYPHPAKGSKSYPIDRERDRNYSSKPNVNSAYMKKRPRSESHSESPPPKRRAQSGDDEDLPGDISSEIWKLFGRKRDSYVAMDVFSDDEDMEADADALEREEMMSARIAKKEDLEAFEAERRHEEEKRKRKKEKERLSRY